APGEPADRRARRPDRRGAPGRFPRLVTGTAPHMRAIDRLKATPGVRLAVAVNERYGKDSGGYLAATIAYYGFFSVLAVTALALSVGGFVLAGNPHAHGSFVN